VPFFVTSSAEVLFAEQLFSTGINVVADTLRPFTPPCASSAYFFVKILMIQRLWIAELARVGVLFQAPLQL
jgi:hypothetical protein